MSNLHRLSAALREQYNQLAAAGDAVPQVLLQEVLSWVNQAELLEKTIAEQQNEREELRLKYVQAKEERNFFQEQVFKAKHGLGVIVESFVLIPPKEDK